MVDQSVTDHCSGTLSDLDQQVVQAVPPGGNWRALPEDFPSARVMQIRESARRGEGSRSTYYGRLEWGKPSYTISTYFTRPGNGCFIHPTAPRLLSIREAARLQTFPDWYRFRGTMRQRAMQIGNAVPPLLAMQLGSMFRSNATAVDLFSGVGGLSLGLQLAGINVVRAVDNNLDAVASYNENLGSHAVAADLSSDTERRGIWSDIVNLTGGEIGILAGGPPCQGFSTAGNALKDDPRNKLVWAFLDGVRVLRPRHVLMENVVALAQSRGRNYLERLQRVLQELGYESRFAIFHAEAYGVPQLRRRVILLASRDRLPEWPTPIAPTLDPTFRKLLPYPRESAGAVHTVRDAISDLPLEEGRDLDSKVRLGPAESLLQEWLRGDRAAERRLLGSV